MNFYLKPILLVFPFGLLSHYLRCLVVAMELRKVFNIMFAHHPKYHKFVAAEGFDTFHCASMNEDEVMAKAKLFDFSWISEQTLEPAFLAQAAAIEKYRPVAVLGDAMPSLKMAAEFTGVTYLSLLNTYMSKYYAGGRTISKTHPMYEYLSVLPASVGQFLIEKGEAIAFRKIHQPFKRLRTK